MLNQIELGPKKIKEIRDYAKADAKWWVRNGKKYYEMHKEEKYKNVENYYTWLIQQNDDKRKRLKLKFGYTDETLEEMAEIYHEAFWSSYKWWENKNVENEVILQKYKSIFDEAEEIAKNVYVLDIVDGFPCGWCILYLKPEAKNTDLGKMLRSQYSGNSYSAKVCHWSAYRLPIEIPSHGQCIEFSRRICEKVAEFLNLKGIPTGVNSYID